MSASFLGSNRIVVWIRGAARRDSVCLALEALALACTTGALVLGAAVISGASVADPAALAVAAITAAMCACMWVIERRRSRLDVARRADRRLEQRGALVAAFEAELDGASQPLVLALISKVASTLTRSALGRAVPWPSPAFAAAPLIAGAALVLSLERAPGFASADRDLLGRVALVAAGAAREAREAGAPDAQVERVLASSQSLEQVAGARRLERDELARELAALETGLSELALSAPSAAAELRAARDLGASASAHFAIRDLARGAGASSARTPNDAGEEARAVANGSATRTMSRPLDPAQVPMNAPSPEQLPPPGTGGEPGTLAGRWWPAHYDAVVAEFTLAERDARR